MKQVRNSMFETNSSSTHSVALRKPNMESKLTGSLTEYIDPADNYIHVPFGEFGWGYDEYEDAFTKLQYLLTMIAETARRDGWHPKYRNNEEFYMLDDFLLLESIVCEHTLGCKGICLASEITECIYDDIVDDEGNPYHGIDFDGYIDHQSHEDYNCLMDFLESWETTIEQFLFDENMRIIIDNDNN